MARRLTAFVVLLLYDLSLGLMIEDKYDICQEGNHAVGEWVFDNSSTKSFFCCPFNHISYDAIEPGKPLCSVDETFAFWMPREEYFTGNDTHFQLVAPNGCQFDNHFGRATVHKSQKYKWKPSYCSLMDWDAKEFCRLLGNRKILIIGDSTGYQSAATLMNMITMGNGGCARQIYGKINDKLELRVFTPWEMVRPDITILLAGAHFHSRKEVHDMWADVIPKYRLIREHYPTDNSTWVWKTQNPGHVGCVNVTEPLSIYHKNSSMDRFAWNLHPVFDEISVKYAKSLGFKIMNMSPLYLRADAHVGIFDNYAGSNVIDCLHYTLPGPVDLFSILLQSMLYTGEL